MVFLLKWISVLVLLVAGCLFLAEGLGSQIPMIKYQGFEGKNLPVGAVLLVAGIALAYFWKVSVTEESSTTTSESQEGTTTTTTLKKVIRCLNEPLHLPHNRS